MLNYFSSFLSLAKPTATETAISQSNRVAKKMGINQNVVDVARVITLMLNKHRLKLIY